MKNFLRINLIKNFLIEIIITVIKNLLVRIIVIIIKNPLIKTEEIIVTEKEAIIVTE